MFRAVGLVVCTSLQCPYVMLEVFEVVNCTQMHVCVLLAVAASVAMNCRFDFAFERMSAADLPLPGLECSPTAAAQAGGMQQQQGLAQV